MGPQGIKGDQGVPGPVFNEYYPLRQVLHEYSLEPDKNPVLPWCGDSDHCVLPLGSKGFMSTDPMMLTAPRTCFNNSNYCFDTQSGGDLCLHYGPQSQFSMCFQGDGNIVKYKQQGAGRVATWSTGQ